jgi:hypothetical protein
MKLLDAILNTSDLTCAKLVFLEDALFNKGDVLTYDKMTGLELVVKYVTSENNRKVCHVYTNNGEEIGLLHRLKPGVEFYHKYSRSTVEID